MRDKNKHIRTPILAEFILSLFFPDSGYYSTLGDLEEAYKTMAKELGRVRAYFWYWSQIPKAFFPFLKDTCYWGGIMIKNYLKTAYRNFTRHKIYSFINLFGLAAGISCGFFILLYILFQLDYDSYQKDADRIFAVMSIVEDASGKSGSAGNHTPLGEYIRDNYSQVEAAARIMNCNSPSVKKDDIMFKEEKAIWGESQFFKVFDIPFISGSPSGCLDRKNTVVFDKSIAEKYFGSENPVGKSININDIDFEITGVYEPVPLNSTIDVQVILSMQNILGEEWMQGWRPGARAVLPFIKLKKNVDPDKFEKEIAGIANNVIGDELEKSGVKHVNKLWPLRRMHLESWSSGVKENSKAMEYVYIFSVTGFLIILVAGMNFMNLSTARSTSRAVEVGMRKVIGANKKQLVFQFLGESITMAVLAFIIGLFLVLIFLNEFNLLATTNYSFSSIFRTDIIFSFFTIALLTGTVAGLYPSFILSAFKPVDVIKGSSSKVLKGKLLRKVLVVGQFAITIALIAGSIIIYQQLNFMKNQPLGFNKQQKLVINLKTWGALGENYQLKKNEFKNLPFVNEVAAGTGVPGFPVNRTWYYPFGMEREQGRGLRSLRCDEDFLKIFNIKLLAGRNFDSKISGDVSSNSLIINKAAVKAFGWKSPEEAIGKGLGERNIPIIGVVDDFHWWGLQREIEPFVMRYVPSMFRCIILDVDTKNIGAQVKEIESKYAQMFPGDIFEYFFVDSNFDRQYRFEEQVGNIFTIFTILGIFIACLGLFGMASFIAEKRTKEIGIRKVLGASSTKIVFMLSLQFINWVLAANIIAWPLAWFAMNKWLENYYYRIELNILPFLLAGVTAVLIALGTVIFNTVKAANSNPVNSLKYE